MLLGKPNVYIPRDVFQKMMFWVDKAEGEVGGMGTVTYDPKGNYFHIRDVFLLEQEVTGGTTDLDATALGKLELEVMKSKLPGDLNFWWHSHVNMNVFWSGTDTETIKQIGEQGYCVATVVNKKREMRSAVCSRVTTEYGQSSSQLTDDLTTIIWDKQPSKETLAQWEKDFNERVKEKKYTYTPPTSQGSWLGNQYNGGSGTGTTGETKSKAVTMLHGGSQKKHNQVSTKNWQVPNENKVKQVLAEWTRMQEGAGDLTLADKEMIIQAASTGVSMNYFNYHHENFSARQWSQLEEYADKFNKRNPNFDWQVTT